MNRHHLLLVMYLYSILLWHSSTVHARRPPKPETKPVSALSHCEELVDDLLTLEKQQFSLPVQGKTAGQLQKEREQLISQYHALEGVEAIINQYLSSTLNFTYRPEAEIGDLITEIRQLTHSSANYHGLRDLFYHFTPEQINGFLSATSAEAFLEKLTQHCQVPAAKNTGLCLYLTHGDQSVQTDFKGMLTGFFLALQNIPETQRAEQFFRPAASAFASSSVGGWAESGNYQAHSPSAARPLPPQQTAEMLYQDKILGEITQALRSDLDKQEQCRQIQVPEQKNRCLLNVKNTSPSRDAFIKYQTFLNSFRQQLASAGTNLKNNPHFASYQETFNRLKGQYQELLSNTPPATAKTPKGQMTAGDRERLRQSLLKEQEDLEGNLRLLYVRQSAHLQQKIHLAQREARGKQTDCENERNRERQICRPINKLKAERAKFQKLLERTAQPGIGPLVDLYQEALKNICNTGKLTAGSEVEKALEILARCQGTNYSEKIAQAKASNVHQLKAIDQQLEQLHQSERSRQLQRMVQLLMAQIQTDCQNSNHLDLINCCEVYQGASNAKSTHQYWALYDSSNQIIAQLDRSLVPALGLTSDQRAEEIEAFCQQGAGLRQCQFTKKRDAFIERGKTYHQTSGKDRLARDFPERRRPTSHAWMEGISRSLSKPDTMPTIGMMIANPLYTDYLTTQAINYKTQLHYQDAWNNAWWDMMYTGTGNFPAYPGAFNYGLQYGYGGYNPFYASNFGYGGASSYRNGFSFSSGSLPTGQ